MAEFNLANSASFLYVLLLLPILLLLRRKFREQRTQKISSLVHNERIREARSVPGIASRVFLGLAGLLVLAGLFFPKFESEPRPREEAVLAREIMLVIDVSGSMGLELPVQRSVDSGPSKELLSSIELTRLVIQDLVEKKRKQDYFGEIFFATEPAWLRTFSRDPNQILGVFEDGQTFWDLAGGTNVHSGLYMAQAVLQDYSNANKIVILLSDLEDVPNQAPNYLRSMLEEGFYVIVVAIENPIAWPDDLGDVTFQALRLIIERLAKSGQHPRLYYLELSSQDDLAGVSKSLNSILDQIPAEMIGALNPPENKKETSRKFILAAIGLMLGWTILNFLYPKLP